MKLKNTLDVIEVSVIINYIGDVICESSRLIARNKFTIPKLKRRVLFLFFFENRLNFKLYAPLSTGSIHMSCFASFFLSTYGSIGCTTVFCMATCSTCGDIHVRVFIMNVCKHNLCTTIRLYNLIKIINNKLKLILIRSQL